MQIKSSILHMECTKFHNKKCAHKNYTFCDMFDT